MRTIVIAVLAILGSVGTLRSGGCPDLVGDQDKYKGRDGRYYCARHHRPIIRRHVFTLPGDSTPLIHFEGDALRLTECNPNSLYPLCSLHRSKEFSKPTVFFYCPECERAVLLGFGIAKIKARNP